MGRLYSEDRGPFSEGRGFSLGFRVQAWTVFVCLGMKMPAGYDDDDNHVEDDSFYCYCYLCSFCEAAVHGEHCNTTLDTHPTKHVTPET